MSIASHTVEQLQAEVMQLRAQLLVRDTALAWEREDRAALEAAIPDLPKRTKQARQIQALSTRIQELLREQVKWQHHSLGNNTSATHARVKASVSQRPRSVLCVGTDPTGSRVDQQVIEQMANYQFLHQDELDTKDEAALEASLRAADLVICQTGCLSHNAYWRLQDHCKRTGKQCVLVEQPPKEAADAALNNT